MLDFCVFVDMNNSSIMLCLVIRLFPYRFGRKSNFHVLQGLETLQSRNVHIGTKQMGDLDVKLFHDAIKVKYPDEVVGYKTMELCSQWEDNLRDPSWHPFKVIVDKEGKTKV